MGSHTQSFRIKWEVMPKVRGVNGIMKKGWGLNWIMPKGWGVNDIMPKVRE